MNFENEWQKLGFARVALREIQAKQSARLAIMEAHPFDSPKAIAARNAFSRDEPKELGFARRVRELQQKLRVGPWLDLEAVGKALEISQEGLELERMAMAEIRGLSPEEHVQAMKTRTGAVRGEAREERLPQVISMVWMKSRRKKLPK
jgi:hypothetical protein